MNKKHQKAFNKAYTGVLTSNLVKLIPNKKKKQYDVVIPLSEVIRYFQEFVNVVEKDLKIGKYKPNKKAKAVKKGR